MLCDQLIRESRAHRTNDPYDRYLRRVAAMCQESERFVLDNDAIDVILNVEESKPTTLEAALHLCRLPFPVMWVEHDLLYRMKQLIPYGYEPFIPKKIKEMRGGILIVATDDTLQRGRIFGVSGGDTKPLVNPSVLDFDLTSVNGLLSRFKAPGRYEVTIKPNYHVTIASSADVLDRNGYTAKLDRHQVEVLTSLENRFLLGIDDDGGEWVQQLRREMGEADAKGLLDASLRDWGGDRRFVLGLLLLLNSRNVYDTQNQTLRQKNAGRSPRLKPDVVSHRVVRIKLTRVAANRMASSGIKGSAAIRAHTVRGHWKVRKHGVYFWRPFTRGKVVDAAMTKEYRVSQ